MIQTWLTQLKQRWQEALNKRGPCPHCHSGRVWHNGVRQRKVSLREAEQTVFIADVPVRRLRCGDCDWRWSLVPERVVSRAHYQPCVVAAAVAAHGLERGSRDTELARRYGCHRRTLLRWVGRVAQVAEPGQLARRLLQESDSPELPAPPPVRPRRSAALQDRSQRAVWVLALLEALASWMGLGAPGLAHLGRLVPASVSPGAGAW